MQNRVLKGGDDFERIGPKVLVLLGVCLINKGQQLILIQFYRVGALRHPKTTKRQPTPW